MPVWEGAAVIQVLSLLLRQLLKLAAESRWETGREKEKHRVLGGTPKKGT